VVTLRAVRRPTAGFTGLWVFAAVCVRPGFDVVGLGMCADGGWFSLLHDLVRGVRDSWACEVRRGAAVVCLVFPGAGRQHTLHAGLSRWDWNLVSIGVSASNNRLRSIEYGHEVSDASGPLDLNVTLCYSLQLLSIPANQLYVSRPAQRPNRCTLPQVRNAKSSQLHQACHGVAVALGRHCSNALRFVPISRNLTRLSHVSLAFNSILEPTNPASSCSFLLRLLPRQSPTKHEAILLRWYSVQKFGQFSSVLSPVYRILCAHACCTYARRPSSARRV
jgi:hypothetical protein